MNAKCAIKTWRVLLCAIACVSATAADLSLDQVRSMLSGAAPSTPADFSGKDLSDLDLSKLDFRKATLERANLNGAWLMGTDFTGANLAGASLLSVVILGGEVKKMPIFKGAKMNGV